MGAGYTAIQVAGGWAGADENSGRGSDAKIAQKRINKQTRPNERDSLRNLDKYGNMTGGTISLTIPKLKNMEEGLYMF